MGTVREVRCITAEWPFMVKGKIYQVIEQDDFGYLIEDEDGDEIRFRKTGFEEVKEAPINKLTGKRITSEEALAIFKKATETPVSAKSTQVGGSHYTKCGIQPYEYTLANNLGGLEHTIIKYVTRWKDKNGVEDLKKARHTIDFLIEWAEKNG